MIIALALALSLHFAADNTLNTVVERDFESFERGVSVLEDQSRMPELASICRCNPPPPPPPSAPLGTQTLDLLQWPSR